MKKLSLFLFFSSFLSLNLHSMKTTKPLFEKKYMDGTLLSNDGDLIYFLQDGMLKKYSRSGQTKFCKVIKGKIFPNSMIIGGTSRYLALTVNLKKKNNVSLQNLIEDVPEFINQSLIHIFTADNIQPFKTFGPFSSGVQTICLSPQENVLAINKLNNKIVLASTKKKYHKQLVLSDKHTFGKAMAFSHNEKLFAYTSSCMIKIYDLSQKKVIKKIDIDATVTDLEFNKAGSRLLVTFEKQKYLDYDSLTMQVGFKIINIKNGKTVRKQKINYSTTHKQLRKHLKH